MDTHAVFPIRWTENEWAVVAKNKVAKRRDRLDGADRVLGMIYIPASIDDTWLAIQDEHGTLVKGMVNEEVRGSTFQKRIWYQSLDLPWPFATRQWIIVVENNHALRTATQGKVWERSWTLVPDQQSQPAKNKLDDAIWLPLNDGGWYLVEVPGGTLVVYHTRTVLSGNLPENAATSYAYMTLGGSMKTIRERATEWIQGHYAEDHLPHQRPDGTDIPRR